MRILAVCDRPPAMSGPQADGSTLISAHVLRGLAASHDVDLAYFPDQPLEPDAALLAGCRSVTPLPLEAAPVRARVLGVASAVPRSGPRTRSLLHAAAGAADVVYLHGVSTFAAAGWFSRPVVVHEVDPHSLFWLDRAREDGWRRSAVAAHLRSRRLARLERHASRHAAAYLLVSQDDAHDLGARLGRPVTAVPNGVPRQAVDVSEHAGVPGRIVFVGGLDYAPNIDSATVLVRDVLPRVRSSVPGAHVVLVGRRPDPRVRALVGDGVLLCDDVPSVDDELALATVAAFPGGFGRGVRNSVLQSLQAGRPVVASTASARSVPPGPHLVVRDAVEDTAEALVAVLTQPELRERAAASARRTALTLPRWEDVVARYAELLDAAAGSRGGADAA